MEWRSRVRRVEGQYAPCAFECILATPAFLAPLDAPHEALAIHDLSVSSQSLSLAANEEAIVATVTAYGPATLATSFDTSLQRIAARRFEGVGDGAWDGSTFVLALRDRESLAVRRLDARLVEASRARMTDVAHADTTLSAPSVAAAIPGNAVVGILEVEANSGARAVAYAEQELGNEPQRRRTVRR